MPTDLELVRYSPGPALTPQQHPVISRIASGSTVIQAAESEQLQRNTVGNWRRTVPAFARELEYATREHVVQTENVHNSAQSCTTSPELGSFVPTAANPKMCTNLHNSAQFCTMDRPEIPRTVRRSPIPGRNSPCPCESGRKYKRCCAQTMKDAIYRTPTSGLPTEAAKA